MRNGVITSGVSAGSNHVGASVMFSAKVICPSAAAARTGAESVRARVRTRATAEAGDARPSRRRARDRRVGGARGPAPRRRAPPRAAPAPRPTVLPPRAAPRAPPPPPPKLSAAFGDTYCREVDHKSEYPEKFVRALT